MRARAFPRTVPPADRFAPDGRRLRPPTDLPLTATERGVSFPRREPPVNVSERLEEARRLIARVEARLAAMRPPESLEEK